MSSTTTTDATPTSDGKIWHKAACHCHEVEYEILFPPLYADEEEASSAPSSSSTTTKASDQASDAKKPPFIMQCNCSVCTKNGYILIYPARDEVRFTKGGMDSLRDYEFATKTRDHKFCPKCGSSIMIDFRGMSKKHDSLGMNARMIKGFDYSRLKLEYGNGRERIAPEFNDQYA